MGAPFNVLPQGATDLVAPLAVDQSVSVCVCVCVCVCC